MRKLLTILCTLVMTPVPLLADPEAGWRVVSFGAPPGFHHYLASFDESAHRLDGTQTWHSPLEADAIVVFAESAESYDFVPYNLVPVYQQMVSIFDAPIYFVSAATVGDALDAEVVFVNRRKLLEKLEGLSSKLDADDELSHFSCFAAGSVYHGIVSEAEVVPANAEVVEACVKIVR